MVQQTNKETNKQTNKQHQEEEKQRQENVHKQKQHILKPVRKLQWA